MYLTVEMGAAHYKLVCGWGQERCQGLCFALANRAHTRSLKRQAQRRLEFATAVSAQLSAAQLATAASMAAPVIAEHAQRLSVCMGQNLRRLGMAHRDESTSGAVPAPSVSREEAAVSTLPAMLAAAASRATRATDLSTSVAVSGNGATTDPEADPEHPIFFAVC